MRNEAQGDAKAARCHPQKDENRQICQAAIFSSRYLG
jgi:hypothetical protein